jgi:hypothetical protein
MEKCYLLKLFREWGEIKENGGGGKLHHLICYKNFYKCHNLPPARHNNKKKRE